MVAKISFGNSLFGALAYNGEKINKDEGKLLATNRIFDDGTGKVNIRRAMEDFRSGDGSLIRLIHKKWEADA